MTAGWWGVQTMARHEFRLRVRSGRWPWLLTTWFVVLLGFVLLERWALTSSSIEPLGTPMFGGLVLVVLGLGLLVVPALSAQSVNGDRERGVLAPVQTTLLRPAEIALGKWLAAWVTALVFLAATLPLVAWCYLEGGVGLGRVLATLAVVALLLGVLAAVSLALSTLFARSTTSSVVAYLVVFALSVGTLVLFGLGVAATQTVETVEQDGFTYEQSTTHPDRVWWLLAPNPFVVLADSAPRVPAPRDPVTGQVVGTPADPLGELSRAIRLTRDPEGLGPTAPLAPSDDELVWPYGLGFHLLLGAGALVVTTRRLRTPYRELPRAVRVA